MAFKVFNFQEEAAELKWQVRLQQKVQLQTQALVAVPVAGRLWEPTERGSQPHPSGDPLQMRSRGTLGSSMSQPKGANSTMSSVPHDGTLEIRLS